VTLLILFCAEGACSWIRVTRRVLSVRVTALKERNHTQYDPELGWVNKANTFIADQYGPGKYLRINEQGFRNNHLITPTKKAGFTRVICSGDSFTLGYGVSNDDTWCEKLSHLGQNIETVNMGQGGYGPDQAFLWYQRDGVGLDHDVVLFSMIDPDFERMVNLAFGGYPKPRLRLENGELMVTQTPVPRRKYLFPWLVSAAAGFNDLSLMAFLQRLLPSAEKAPEAVPDQAKDEKEVEGLMGAILHRLNALTANKGRRLVVISIPFDENYRSEKRPYASTLQAIADREHFRYLDLRGAFDSFEPSDVKSLFDPVHKHYSEAGNARMASLIHGEVFPSSVDKKP
jgi:hypothetical protein